VKIARARQFLEAVVAHDFEAAEEFSTQTSKP